MFARLALFALVIVSLGFAQIETVQAQGERTRIITTENSDYYGFDLLTEKDVSLDQCKASCLSNLGCVAFTYNTSARFCFLKSDFGPLNSFPGAIAGRVVSSTDEQDIGAPPKLTFIPDYMYSEARKYRAKLEKNRSIPGTGGFEALTRLAQQNLDSGDNRAAVNNAYAALKIDPDAYTPWLTLSAAARAYRAKKYSDKQFMKKLSVSSALNGYLVSRTKTARAEALARLAKGLQKRGKFRLALSAYKFSLELVEVPAERQAFTELRRTHGFRVLNHTVDSDNLNPRICVQFSEDLNTSASNYESFLSINSSAPKAIDVKKRQICIEGLQHGKNYQIGLREGLPSTMGEALQINVNLKVYIRDRKPMVRFTGSSFVLPLSARRGIPLVTVNTDKANLKLYRIGERALAPLLRNSRFLQQLSQYQVEDLTNNLGEPTWNGSISITPDLNKEVVTSIPIDEALPSRKPGIYVMTATPASNGPNDYNIRATQWFVISDIGLTTFSGSGNLRVFARSLSSAKPMANVEISLIARNNELLGTTRTNATGEAVFDAGFVRGKGGLSAAVVTAKKGNDDFVLLDISKPGFDFSDRGVTGRPVPKGVDVYAWTERGIYRAGETVHVAALARDASVRAIKALPLTFVFTRPDGVEERRIINKGAALGGYAVQLPLTDNAKRGTWQVQVYTDPKKNPVAEQRFLVEDFLPERTDFSLLPAQDAIAVGRTGSVKVEGRYLYGAPASGLSLEGELVVRAKRSRKGYKAYLFGLATEEKNTAQHLPVNNIPPLNAKGESTFTIALKNTAATTRPQSAELVVRMREGSGRAVERRVAIDVVPQHTMIGIRPHFADGQIAENSIADFGIIAVDPSGGKTALPQTSWSLVKIERNYQWYRDGSHWRYESVNLETKIADGTIDVDADALSKLSLPVEWGRYRLDLESHSKGSPATSVEFNAGWFVDSKSTDTPDGLEIALDKNSYKAGDTARLKVSPRYAGEMLIAIGTDQIVETRSVTIPATGATIDIPVGSDWGAGAYVLATLYRPGDAGKSRMPMRSIGIKWLTVDPQDQALKVALDMPAQTQPREMLRIPVSVSGLAQGEEAYVMVAAVDVGILNLTNYPSPDPVKRYFGQRKLGVGMRDIYGRLIDGSLGVTGRLRTGGDGAEGMSTNGSPPTEKLVAFFSGIIRLNDAGEANIEFDIPQFNGSVRIIATAWTDKAVGSSETDLIIRDPLVVTASLPKFMAPGDTARLLVEVANTDAPAGVYNIDFESSDNLVLADDHQIQSLDLIAGEKTSLNIPVSANSVGKGWARIRMTGENGLSVTHEIAINIRPGLLPLTRKIEVSLAANGGSLVIDKNLLGGSQLDGARINISIARPSAFDVPSLIMQLSQYPYGCAEQITSKALPLLYVNDFSTSIPGLDSATIKERIQKAINKVLAYQSSNGGFSLWGTQANDLWLGAYVTDFLTRAIEKGYNVPAQPMKLALQNLQNVLAYQNDLKENDAAIAYALYVLARNKQASAGDLRYYADTQLQLFKTPISRAQLAAGMALYGDQQRAERTFDSAFQLAKQSVSVKGARYSYGSRLRDASAMLALATESRPKPSNTAGMRHLVSTLRKADTYTSTQEKAWMLLAARGLKAANDNISMDINGERHIGAFTQLIEGAEIAANPIRVINRHGDELQATVTTIAVPDQPLPAGGNGFTIKRTYYRLDGSKVNVSEVMQNERFVVVIKFIQLRDVASRLIVSDLLPAGFEIDNPHLVGSADLKNFKWLPGTETAHSEFRSDRFVAAFDRSKGGKTDFTVAYTVRAVSPGVFTHPAATVEDMYRPQLSARTATGWMEVRQPR